MKIQESVVHLLLTELLPRKRHLHHLLHLPHPREKVSEMEEEIRTEDQVLDLRMLVIHHLKVTESEISLVDVDV